MSRTIRNINFGRKPNCPNQYYARFGYSARHLLKGGKPPSSPSREIWIQYADTYRSHKYTVLDIEVGNVAAVRKIRSKFDDIAVDDWRHPDQVVGIHYVEKAIKRWKRIKNPLYDEDVADAHQDWLRIHSHVYRNGMSYRQRRHGIAHCKKRNARIRRLEGERAMRRDVQEFYSE